MSSHDGKAACSAQPLLDYRSFSVSVENLSHICLGCFYFSSFFGGTVVSCLVKAGKEKKYLA